MAYELDEPDTAGWLDPKEIIGDLLIVWAIRYIEHSPTKHSVPGRNSDVVVVDGVNLDRVGADGTEGVIIRNSWWRQGRLIMVLKKRIGNPKPILIRLSKGTSSNSPYELHTQTADPDAMRRYKEWWDRNPDFEPTNPGEVEASPAQAPAQPQQLVPQGQRAWGGGPGPLTQVQETPLEAQARLAQGPQPQTAHVLAKLRGLKTNHRDEPQDEIPPY